MLIPKIFHFIWIGPHRFPYKSNIDTYKQLHPDWEFKLWTDDNIPTLVNQKIYDQIPVYATKADLLRLELLYKYGGVYVDVDSKCLKNIEPLISKLTLFAATSNARNKRMTNNTLGVTPKHQAYLQCINGVLKRWESSIRGQKEVSVYIFGGSTYLYKFMEQYPDFVQIKKHYISSPKEVSKDTYIVQYNEHSWRESTTHKRSWRL